uniref:S-protein homolog n=1 Tax=Manihot esculenta TaxID=3983 RepID=A0A2C9WA93_MANES
MLVISSVSGAAGLALEKTRTVNVTNDLSTNIKLKLHCKSKNDDLGDYKGFWYFNWGQKSHWFDIYIDSRDNLKCVVCQWNIQAKGPCRWNEDSQ